MAQLFFNPYQISENPVRNQCFHIYMYQVQLLTNRNRNVKLIFILFSLQLRIGIQTSVIP